MTSSIQAVTEDIVLKLTKSISEEYKIKNLCWRAALHLIALPTVKFFKKLFLKIFDTTTAAGDAGGSLGAALGYWYRSRK